MTPDPETPDPMTPGPQTDRVTGNPGDRPATTYDYDDTNVFARILRGEIPNRTVYEGAHALAFHDITPQAPVHVMVIPKGPYVSLDHFARDATPEEQTGFFAAVAEVCAMLDLDGGFRAIANARGDGGQEVPHFHLHLVGGAKLGPMLPK